MTAVATRGRQVTHISVAHHLMSISTDIVSHVVLCFCRLNMFHLSCYLFVFRCFMFLLRRAPSAEWSVHPFLFSHRLCQDLHIHIFSFRSRAHAYAFVSVRAGHARTCTYTSLSFVQMHLHMPSFRPERVMLRHAHIHVFVSVRCTYTCLRFGQNGQ